MKTELIVLIDRSGSMESIDAAAAKGFNDFITEQREVPGECLVTLARFDDQYQLDYVGRPIAQVPIIRTVEPRGSTALRDAMAQTIIEQGGRIATQGWADKVIFCTVTDGLENASRRWSEGALRELIQAREANGWSFVYLGANQNAVEVASRYGMNTAYASTFAANAAGTQAGYRTMSATTRALRGVTF